MVENNNGKRFLAELVSSCFVLFEQKRNVSLLAVKCIFYHWRVIRWRNFSNDSLESPRSCRMMFIFYLFLSHFFFYFFLISLLYELSRLSSVFVVITRLSFTVLIMFFFFFSSLHKKVSLHWRFICYARDWKHTKNIIIRVEFEIDLIGSE